MLEYFKPQDRAYGEIAVETISYVAQKGETKGNYHPHNPTG